RTSLHKVKAIKCDNGTEFKNVNLIEFCGSNGIRRNYSNARTPQQNGVAERKNRTLIEAARTMLAYSLLPTIFWSEAVATACYVLNRVLVTKAHHKTPYELLTRDKPSISYLKPFGCHVTILNTSDLLGKFDKKSDEGSQEDDSDSDDEPGVLIIHSTPTLVVPIVDEATTQNDGTK
nr:ribonuclease H-like domain-containing protein [Tanacetum cinerariifolium]